MSPPKMGTRGPGVPGPPQSCWGQKGVQEGTNFQGEVPASRVDRPICSVLDLRGGPSPQRLGLWDRVSPGRWS